MKQSKLELIVGVFVFVGLMAVAYLALKIGAGSFMGTETYSIRARFTHSGGLTSGSNVLIAGVPVGRVGVITLNPADFSALVELRLNKIVQLPSDTIASIKTTGLIGDKYVGLAPGSDTAFLAAGSTITDTESAVDIESLISRFAFGNVEKKGSK